VTTQLVQSANTGMALPSVEKARALLAKASTDHEVRQIRAIAQAVATLERGKEIACDAGEIIVLADTRRAELEAEERAARTEGRPRKNGNSAVAVSKALPKSQTVAESRRAPLLTLPEQDRDRYFKACRANLQPPTPAAAATLAKLPPESRKKVFAKLGDDADVKAAIRAVKIAERPVVEEEEPGAPFGEPVDPSVWDADDFMTAVHIQVTEWFREWRAHGQKASRLAVQLKLCGDLEEKVDGQRNNA
jgi:hypothetical protein